MTLSHAQDTPSTVEPTSKIERTRTRWGTFRSTIAPFIPSTQRYTIAILAPTSVAAAQLALQLLLLRKLEPAAFGLFAFLMVIVQLGLGLSNALIATPYTVLAHRNGFDSNSKTTFFTINALFASGFGMVVGGLGLLYGGTHWLMFFSVYASLAMLRWFGRAHAYAEFRQARAAVSDVVYAMTLSAAIALLWWLDCVSLSYISAALALATLLGIGMIGKSYRQRQFHGLSLSSLPPYRKIWREQSRWALLGVATTEATSNAHSYLVTTFAGPSAFAPLAAASLFMKPVALAITSLTQVERPVISKAIATGDSKKADTTRRHFQIALGLAWLVAAAGSALVIWGYPELILRSGYDLSQIAAATTLFAAIAGIQALQAPNSVLLQAADKFRDLASYSLKACLISIAGVAALLWLGGPIWSLAGIVLGQAFMTRQITKRANQWRSGDA